MSMSFYHIITQVLAPTHPSKTQLLDSEQLYGDIKFNNRPVARLGSPQRIGAGWNQPTSGIVAAYGESRPN